MDSVIEQSQQSDVFPGTNLAFLQAVSSGSCTVVFVAIYKPHNDSVPIHVPLEFLVFFFFFSIGPKIQIF